MKSEDRVDRLVVVPRHYLVTSGTGISTVSTINAFDSALKAAGIGDLNLVKVSSILPRNVRRLSFDRRQMARFFEKGEIVFVVEAKATGTAGQHLYSGLMWAEGVDSSGLVMEHTCKTGSVLSDPENWIIGNTQAMKAKFDELVRSRDTGTRDPETLHVELSVPEGAFGCALVALVLC